MILPKFQFAGRHALNIISSVYLAAIIANAVAKFVPNMRVTTFIVLSVSLILFDIAVIMRELQHGRDSLALAGIGALPPVIVGIALVVFIARTITHLESAPVIGPMLGFFGIIFWVWFYSAVIVGTYQKQRLEEDLANKPSTPSNQSLQPTAGRRTEKLKDEL
jgi:cell division protein FtsW (lipid II flippase)